MLILHTSHTYLSEPSGVGHVVMQLSTRLARRGHEVVVATTRARGLPEREHRDGVEVRRFDLRGTGMTRVHGDVAGYLDYVTSRPWGVIAMHQVPSATTDPLMPHLGRLSGARILVSHGMHGFEGSPGASDGGYFSWLGARAARLDALVALSGLLRREASFCTRFGVTGPVVIPNGVDPHEWAAPPVDVRARWGVGSRPWVVAVSNHNGAHKGHQAFFELMDDLGRPVPEVTGTIIGRPHLAARWGAGRIGVKGGCWYRCRIRAPASPRVRLEHGAHRAAVVSAVKEADVLVVPSSAETSPLVVLEAMAAGTPWVSFDVGCVREHTGGEVVGDVGAMLSACARLLGDAGERTRLGAAGAARARELHDWERITDRYESLYRRLAPAHVKPTQGLRP